MLLKILIGFAALVILLIVFAALKPAEFKVERSITINAPKEAVFAHINNLQKLDAWNPWSKQDPTMKMTFEGPQEGVGAKSSWVSDGHGGIGSMTIVESVPNELVKCRLDFVKPFAGTNIVEYPLQGNGNSTTVSWIMTGKMHFVPRMFSLFFDMDKMMGTEFEKGLAHLKQIVETPRQ